MIVVKALVLCATADTAEAVESVRVALENASFESHNPVMDYGVGVHDSLVIGPEYRDGAFLASVRDGNTLVAANLLPV